MNNDSSKRSSMAETTLPTIVRESRQSDMDMILQVYCDAFPVEDLRPLVRELLSGKFGVLSLVAVRKVEIVGHIAFTPCRIDVQRPEIALLGPLAVASAMQRKGIGSALIREGLRQLERSGFSRVQVLGDPAYYGRFGFLPDYAVSAPYELPAEWHEAWRFLSIGEENSRVSGKLDVPPPWRKANLWTA
jgi:putative acetyltransferase